MRLRTSRHFLPPSWPWIVALFVTFCGALPAPLARAADAPLSFNLERVEDRTGDYPLVFYTFRCGSKRYTFCPPATWKIDGNAAGMTFSIPTSAGEGVARFRVSGVAELALLNPDQSARREAALRQYLPAGYTELHQIGSVNMNPEPAISIRGAEASYRFNFFGRLLEASVMICQLDALNGFTLVTIVPLGTKEDFIGQVRRTLGATGVAADKPPGSAR